MHASVTYDSTLNVSTVTFSDGVAGSDVSIHLSGNYTERIGSLPMTEALEP